MLRVIEWLSDKYYLSLCYSCNAVVSMHLVQSMQEKAPTPHDLENY